MRSLRERTDTGALRAHRFLMRVGLSLANVFAWIFIFNFSYAITRDLSTALSVVVILYALSQFITIVFTPITAAHLRRGSRHTLIWAAVLAAGAFVYLGAGFEGYFQHWSIASVLATFAVMMGMYRALYFVPYQVTLAATNEPHKRMQSIFEIVIALMPLFAGLTVAFEADGPERLLFGAAAIIIISIIPVLFLGDTHEKYSWTYTGTYARLFSSKHGALVTSSFLDGVQGAALFLLWPIVVFLVVDWSYASLGLVFSVTLLLVLTLRGAYDVLTAPLKIKNSVPIQAAVAASGWIVRLAAGTPVGIIAADTYGHSSGEPRATLSDPFAFEQVADRGSFVDEFTVLKEISLGLGRMLMCVVVGLISAVAPIEFALGVALVFAAISSALSIIIARTATAEAY